MASLAADVEIKIKQHGLRLTDCRIEVLTYFFKNQRALTHSDLERALPAFDRVTLYRTLSTFVEKGLIHKIPDMKGIDQYASCAEHCAEHSHYDNHIHFKCKTCGQTTCLDNLSIPQVRLPQGFTLSSATFLIEGSCNRCLN